MISYAPLFKTMKDKQITSYRLEKLGFSRATYYSIKQGNSVSTNTINQLCKLLKCSVSDVMEFIDEDEETWKQMSQKNFLFSMASAFLCSCYFPLKFTLLLRLFPCINCTAHLIWFCPFTRLGNLIHCCDTGKSQ